MVQTKSGTKSNAWIEYMKACAANYRQGKGIQSAVQGRKSKACPDKTEDSHKRQTDSAIKQARAAKREKLATQGRERREKARKDQEEAAKATAKKMGKAIGKKIADQTGKV